MTRKFDYIIAIDPDVDKSGVALLDVRQRQLTDVSSKSFEDIMSLLYVLTLKEHRNDTLVVVEAGYANRKASWHTDPGMSANAAAKTGYNTGRNHQRAIDIVGFARFMGFDVAEQPPLRKIWKGKDRKISHEELTKIVGGFAKRSNQDQRDAVLLAWNAAGLPIKL